MGGVEGGWRLARVTRSGKNRVAGRERVSHQDGQEGGEWMVVKRQTCVFVVQAVGGGGPGRL